MSAAVRSPLPSTLRAALRLCAGVTAAAMIITRELDPLFLAGFVLFFLLGFKVEKMGRLARLLSRLQPLFAIFFFFLAVADFFFLSRSFLIAVAHFLLSLQGVRLLSLRTIRDSLGSILLSSMMLLSASTLSVEWTFFIFLSSFLPLAVWTLILMTLASDHQMTGASTDPNATPKEVSLAAAGLSERYLPEDDKPIWKSALPVAGRSTAIAFTTAAIWCAIVFVVFPRFNFRGFRGQFLQPVHKTGFTNRVDLGKSSTIFEDESVVMRVEVDPKDRPLWPGALRGGTLGYFDGRLWLRGESDQPQITYGTREGLSIPLKHRVSGPRVIANIYLESMDTPVLFAAPVVTKIRLDRPFVLVAHDGTIERARNDTWRLHYRTESVVQQGINAGVVFSSQADTEKSLAPYRALPPAFDRAALEPILNSLIVPGDNSFRFAERISGHLRDTYDYTLDLSSLDEKNPLIDFLVTKRKGNCEFFASGMCVLLRMQGIPARVATGFQAHEWNDRGNYYVVRMKDAHAWVEAFIGGEWRTFDPTPRVFDEESKSMWPRRFRNAMDFLNLRWNRYILSYDMQRQVGFLQDVGSRSRRWTGQAEDWFAGIRAFRERLFSADADLREIVRESGRGLTVLILLFGAGCSFFVFRRNKTSLSPWYYRALLSVLRRRGIKKAEGQTLYELISSSQDRLGSARMDVQFVADAYYASRFGNAPAPADQLKAALHRIRG